jgi:acetyl esterase/lipase
VWRALMARLAPGELRRFNADPIHAVEYHRDLDYIGDGIRAHRLDVLVPHGRTEPLPVYVYFHGGGWTSGDKGPLTKYCASQARGGMVVVNANYRTAGRAHMGDILEDANATITWVAREIAAYGGDPTRIVLGGDSAGGQIAALLAATSTRAELADHYGIRPALLPGSLRGLVQHCSAVDFSVVFERGFILGLQFVQMLLPERVAKKLLPHAARFLSPIEWLSAGFPPVLVTTSEQDYFYRANLNFIARLKSHRVQVETVILGRRDRNAHHTWQQDASFAESQLVYQHLHRFVERVTAAPQQAV